jgi:hypothetical protein
MPFPVTKGTSHDPLPPPTANLASGPSTPTRQAPAMTKPTEPPDVPPAGLPHDLSERLGAYLVVLAGRVGYDVDLDELDPVTGFHPALVVSWALSGARHAGLAHARSLLAGPAAFLREQDFPANRDDGLHAGMLADIVRVRDRLDRDLFAATGAYAGTCQALADTGLGLVWPREGQPDDPPPGGQPPPTT